MTDFIISLQWEGFVKEVGFKPGVKEWASYTPCLKKSPTFDLL